MHHIYTGDGKGKTTAAVGLAVRCAGSGRRVLFTQFLKPAKSGEIEAMEDMENMNVIYGILLEWFYRGISLCL